jgi:hypothetical protein
MDVGRTVTDYYEALRAGEPLAPYFRAGETTVKFGLSERLFGAEAVATALREQTAHTRDWTVESHNLVTGAPDEGPTAGTVGWFADEVDLAWTDTDRGIRFEFDTRWSGTVVDGAFATMHVSTAEAV